MQVCTGFKGVTWSKSKQAWICQTQDQTLSGKYRQVCGLHGTQESAAKALANFLSASIEHLKKSDSSKSIAASRITSHFEEVQKVYSAFEMRDLLPGDLRDLLMNGSDAKLGAPIRLLISQLKYTPYRDIARAVARKHKFARVEKKFIQLLLKMFQAVPSQELAPWRASVGLGLGGTTTG